MPSPYRTSLFFFCGTTFFYWMALYLYAPILPIYAQSLGASLSMVGIIIASYAVPQVLLRIPIGVWSDAFGRQKPFVAGGIIVTALGALGLALAPDPWLLFVARIITGIGAATWASFTVYFVSYYPSQSVGRPIGVISFLQGASIVVASLCSGFMAESWGLRYTFFGAALTGIISLVLLIPAREPVTIRQEKASWRSAARVVTNPLLLVASSLGILVWFVLASSTFGFVPVYSASIGASSADIGIITMLAVGSLAVGSLVALPVTRKMGNRVAIVLGSLLMCTLLAVPFIKHIYVLEVVQVAFGLGSGVVNNILMTLSIRFVASGQRATAMGVYQAVYALGMLLGPLVSGFLADSQGLASVFCLSAFLSLVIAGTAFLPILPRR